MTAATLSDGTCLTAVCSIVSRKAFTIRVEAYMDGGATSGGMPRDGQDG
jgi:hypothetical protein